MDCFSQSRGDGRTSRIVLTALELGVVAVTRDHGALT